MEQVLSSPRGRSDWESDQNSLGFLLLDNGDVAAESGHENPERHQRAEPGIVSLSFDEIFQDSSLNLDELFRASRYSGLEQAYSWECTSECVGPSWDKQQSLPQKPAAEDCCETSHDVVTADLINFNSTAPSPTHTCTSLQAVESLQSVETDRPLDGLIGRLPLGPVLDQAPSQTLPARRTSVVDGSPDSHRTKDLSSSQTAPENTTDVLCGNLTGLAEESGSKNESCNFENSLEALIPLPFIYDLSSSPHCSVSHPDDSDELLPSLFLDSLVRPCDGSHAIFQTADTTTAGLSSEQEDDIPSISNMIPDEASKVWSRPQSPADSLASSTLSVPERTLAGLDSEGKPGATHMSLAPNGTPEGSSLGFSHNCLCEDEMTVELEEAVERDLAPNEPVEQELGSDFDQAFLSSHAFIPEPTAPVESTTISQVSLSLQTGRSPEFSSDELRTVSEIDIKSETASDLKENSTLSVTFASEKDIIVNTFPALEKEPPPISPSSCLSLEANAKTDAISLVGSESQTRTSSELERKHNPSESTNMPEDTGRELTINLPNVDTLVTETHTLVAVDTHLLLHVQGVASVNTSINGTTRHCQDSNGCTNTQDESECLCSGTRNYTPETDVRVTFDGLLDSHTLTESSDSSLNTHTPEPTPVSKENDTISRATLPAPGSPKVESVCVQQGEREGSYSDQGAFFGSGLDPTLLSGADSPLSQLGRAMEQERGEATSRLCQSADVRVDGETDLPDQADLSQVAQPKVNPLRDESPSGFRPLEETCPPLMGDDDIVVVPDGPDDAEMALEIFVSSDLIQDGSVGASALPAANPQDDERSVLQAVFQALDQDGDGFVRIEEFMEFATAYGVEQVMSFSLFSKRLHVSFGDNLVLLSATVRFVLFVFFVYL